VFVPGKLSSLLRNIIKSKENSFCHYRHCLSLASSSTRVGTQILDEAENRSPRVSGEFSDGDSGDESDGDGVEVVDAKVATVPLPPKLSNRFSLPQSKLDSFTLAN
jgi:hypothetical protein